jgi:hypothetical protein
MVLLDCVIEKNQFDIIEEVDLLVHTCTSLKGQYLRQYFCYCYEHAFQGKDIALKIIIKYIVASKILC